MKYDSEYDSALMYAFLAIFSGVLMTYYLLFDPRSVSETIIFAGFYVFLSCISITIGFTEYDRIKRWQSGKTKEVKP